VIDVANHHLRLLSLALLQQQQLSAALPQERKSHPNHVNEKTHWHQNGHQNHPRVPRVRVAVRRIVSHRNQDGFPKRHKAGRVKLRPRRQRVKGGQRERRAQKRTLVEKEGLARRVGRRHIQRQRHGRAGRHQRELEQLLAAHPSQHVALAVLVARHRNDSVVVERPIQQRRWRNEKSRSVVKLRGKRLGREEIRPNQRRIGVRRVCRHKQSKGSVISVAVKTRHARRIRRQAARAVDQVRDVGAVENLVVSLLRRRHKWHPGVQRAWRRNGVLLRQQPVLQPLLRQKARLGRNGSGTSDAVHK
jgi:hypothetical protein